MGIGGDRWPKGGPSVKKTICPWGSIQPWTVIILPSLGATPMRSTAKRGTEQMERSKLEWKKGVWKRITYVNFHFNRTVQDTDFSIQGPWAKGWYFFFFGGWILAIIIFFFFGGMPS